jgi:hypothetical protein
VPAGISANETLAIGHRGLGAQTMSLCCVCAPSQRTPYTYYTHTHLSDLYARSHSPWQQEDGLRKCDCALCRARTAERTHHRWNVVAAFSECIKSNVHRRFYTKKCTLTSRENDHIA